MVRRAVFAILVITSSFLPVRSARADALHARTECDRLATGTACIRDDGAAGLCERRPDPLHPEQTRATCARNEHFCDGLPEAAPCPGYLGQPSHCRIVRDPSRTPPLSWRSCLSDLAIGTPLGAGLTPAARMTTPSVPSGPVDLSQPPLPDAGASAVTPATPSSATRRGCDAGPRGDGLMAVGAALGSMLRARNRRAKSTRTKTSAA